MNTPILPEGHASYGALAPDKYWFFINETNVVCPICQTRFPAFLPQLSKLGQKEYRVGYDLRVTYENFDPIWFEIWVCPECNYAAYHSTFSKVSEKTAMLLSKNGFRHIFKKFSGFARPMSVDSVIESYYLAILCNGMGERCINTDAKTWLRLYWLYSDRNDRNNRLTAAANALYKYEAVVLDASGDEKNQINAIIAELAIVLSDYNKAAFFYEKISTSGDLANSSLFSQAQMRLLELKDKL